MNERELCCGTVADKAKLCAEVAERDLRIKSLERERNELAAQVERLRSEFPLFDDDGLCEHEHHCEFTLLQERKRLHEMLAETPPAALASLKAQWQSEKGREAFIHGYFHCRKFGFQFEDDLEKSATMYSESIRQRAQWGGK